MSGTKSALPKKAKDEGKPSGWTILLMLSLVPIGLGVLGFVLWGGFDKVLFESEEVQLLVSGFYLLLGFSLNNLARRNWILAVAWILPTVAVIVALNVTASWGSIAALAMAGFGVLLLIVGFIQQYRIQRQQT